MSTATRRVRLWLGLEGSPTQRKLRPIVASRGIEISRAAGLMLVESGGQHDVISSAGAVGLMQVMPSDAPPPYNRYFGERPSTAQLLIPCVNVAWGCAILRDAWWRWGGDWKKAHAAYLGGIRSDGRITAEGQHYVDLVEAAIAQFRDLDV